MPNYSKSKIYKVVCDETNLTYYGSTIQPLYKRLSEHKKKDNNCKTKLMTNPKIYLVVEFPCENKEQLLRKEREYIENNECINKQIPLRTTKEYYQDNKEELSLKNKQYRQDNKEQIKQYKKQYIQDNIDKIKEQRKQYFQDNKEHLKELNKQYKKDNIEQIKEQKKQYRINLEIFECECGSKFKKDSKLRHERSQKHIKFIELKNSNSN